MSSPSSRVSMTHALGVLVLILGLANLYLHHRISYLQTQVLKFSGSQNPTETTLAMRIAGMEEKDAKLVEFLNKALLAVSQSTPTVSQSKPTAASGSAPLGAGLGAETGPADDAHNVRYPTKMVAPADDSPYGEYQVVPLSLGERLRYMELKTNAYFNWANHYNLESKVDGTCRHKSDMAEFDQRCVVPGKRTDEVCSGLYDHHICMDSFKGAKAKGGKPCLVYDFGIREQPHFGVMMAEHFGCEVHAFDPSPISTAFFKNNKKIQAIENYHFHGYGAGGRDGDITLFEYNWGQVSIVQNSAYINSSGCQKGFQKDAQCPIIYPAAHQKEFPLEVRTIPSIMKELKHKWVDVIKVDVEGSEFALMENMFDIMGCPPCDQFTVEWHHFPIDSRYGAGASPPLNALVTILHKCGFRQFHHHLQGGWPSSDKIYDDMHMHDMRYNIVSFHREKPRSYGFAPRTSV